MAALPLLIFATGSVAAVTLQDGEWEGRWYPVNSCKDTRERKITATVSGNHIRGEVHNPPASPGIFAADIKPNGKFSSTVVGLKRFGFSVDGRASPTEIKANWEGRDDCGNGRLVLRPVAPEEPEQPPAPEAVPADPARAALETLRNQGVISEAEYQAKLKALAPGSPPLLMAPSDLPPPDPRLAELDDLLTRGGIDADEYLARRRAILGSDN